jgi:predicted adenine nucleotide alpha hydrolase (AANH) superfamily ATPase
MLQNAHECHAAAAADNSFSAFTSTLLISPYQDHELLIKIGQESRCQTWSDFSLYRFQAWIQSDALRSD